MCVCERERERARESERERGRQREEAVNSHGFILIAWSGRIQGMFAI